MKVLIVGGSGLIGGHAALHLHDVGHAVTIASRNRPAAESPLAQFAFLPGDYVAGSFTAADLAGFDALVFCAGNDPRHVKKGEDSDARWQNANIEGVPRFFALAREAGIAKAVNIGSFYPQAAPALVETNAYVRSRHMVDEAVRALARPGFDVVCVNPPYVIGTVPGVKAKSFGRLIEYLDGGNTNLPIFAPPGGVNFMSTQSLSEAIACALARGASGTSYLVGDENLSFQAYFSTFTRALGKEHDVPVVNKEHPMIGSFAGHGGTLYFEPDLEEVKLLGYRRKDIARTVSKIVAQHKPSV